MLCSIKPLNTLILSCKTAFFSLFKPVFTYSGEVWSKVELFLLQFSRFWTRLFQKGSYLSIKFWN